MRLFSERLHTRARFYDTLATALDAGLTSQAALTTLAGSGDRTAAALLPTVAGGMQLSEALSQALAADGSFRRFEALAVEAGERAGRLPDISRRLGRAFQVRARARDRTAYGLLYPVVLIHGAVLLPPAFLLFRDGLDAYLEAVVPVFLVAYGLLAVATWLIRGFTATEAGKLRRDLLLLRIPGVSLAARAVALADYAQAFAMLYTAGVPLPETLDRAAESTRNRAFRAAARRVGERVRSGGTLQDGLATARAAYPQTFPLEFAQAIAVGEEAGKLEETLDKAEEDARLAAERATFGLAVAAGVVAYGIAAALVAWVVIRFFVDATALPPGV